MYKACRCDTDEVLRQYEKITNDIVDELNTKGYCKLLDEVLSESYLNIKCIEYYCLANALKKLQGEECIKLNLIDKVDPLVFGHRSNKSLAEMAFMPINRKINIKDYMLFKRLVDIGRKKHLEYIEKIKNDKRIYINKDVLETEKIAEFFSINEKKEADSIIRQAEDESRRIKKDAERFGEECRNQARQQAEQFFQQQLIDNKDRLNKELLKYIREQQFDLSHELKELKNDFIVDNESKCELRNKIHEEVLETTSRLQSDFISKVDEQIQSLNQFKLDLYNDLRRWQMTLNYNDVLKLARLYIEFYQIIHIDNIISQEFLKQLEEKNKNSVLNELLKMKNALERYLVKFENALSGVGLYVYYPEEDDEYNEVLHKVYRNDDEKENVSRCIIPGVKQVSNADVEGKVIIPAIVELK